jgi:hypothetical protein
MVERVRTCPKCAGPLPEIRFARTLACPYCGAVVEIDPAHVSASTYREALAVWNAPSHDAPVATIGESHWGLGPLLAHGEISDVYAARRARWPTERVVLKVLRDEADRPLFDNEWDVLERLQESQATGAPTFLPRLPQPVVRGELSAAFPGRRAMVFRWASGFTHTLEAIARAFPGGIEARASIWIWRRILEVLSFLHASGTVHGAVLPSHLLVQDHEHGVRLVGLSCADRPGSALRAASTRFEAFYPPDLLRGGRLEPEGDIEMSGRCVAALNGGDPSDGRMPSKVPAPLAELVREVASGRSQEGAWGLRERLGQIANEVYGPPVFCPVVMPRGGKEV